MENSDIKEIITGTPNKGKDNEKKIDNTNYKKVIKEDKSEIFVCNICSWEANEAKRVKKHISMKHRERSLDSDEDDDEAKRLKKDEKSLLEDSSLDQWDKTGMVTSTQLAPADDILSMFDEHGNALMSNDTRIALDKTGNITVIMKDDEDQVEKLNKKITEMESEILDKTKEVSRLETEIQVKNDLGR